MTGTIDGKEVAESVREGVSEAVDDLGDAGVRPTLATVLMSTDPASETYVSMKQSDCEEVGIATEGKDAVVVGPMTRAMLLYNTAHAAGLRSDVEASLSY
ncbi:hypothetical protein BRC92_03980 [Halobacteriales archaeon QS_4_69_31]|nr:MAG: hypothetical protein BRC92_03980 [Halobacteriales archaeon QS_4_69_31]